MLSAPYGACQYWNIKALTKIHATRQSTDMYYNGYMMRQVVLTILKPGGVYYSQQV